MDYYVVLGVGEDADEETIRSAFRALARRYHPDVGTGASSVEFQRAREAYETLVDPQRRRRYDRQLRASRTASRTRPVVVRESMVSRRFAEPLFSRRPLSFDAADPWRSLTRSLLFEEVVEALFASLDEDWIRTHRWR
jgi:curved DNA-binding protein CbpA